MKGVSLGTISFPSPGFPVNFLAFLTLHASNLWSLKPKPTVARTDLFCSVEMSDPARSKKTWFWNPDHSFHTANNRGFHGDKRNSSGETKTRCPAIPRRGLEFLFRQCLNRLYEGFLFAGAQSLVSLTWPRSMQRSRVPECQLLTRAIHRGGP